MPEPILMCWSGGKDSALSLHELQRRGEFQVVGLLTTMTSGFDRVSMHGVRRELLLRQAASLGLPLIEAWITPHAANPEYEQAMLAALHPYRERGVAKVAFGDIFLRDLRDYRERLLARLGMECLFPIWERHTEELIDSFLNSGFRAVTCCIDPRVLPPSFAGREIDRQFVQELPAGIDPCGENGEFHSFVFDGPMFSQPIRCICGDRVQRDSFLFCDLLPQDAIGNENSKVHEPRPVGLVNL